MTKEPPKTNIIQFPQPIAPEARKEDALRHMEAQLALLEQHAAAVVNSRELLIIGRYLRDMYARDDADQVTIAVAMFAYNELIRSLAQPIELAREALRVIEVIARTPQ